MNPQANIADRTEAAGSPRRLLSWRFWLFLLVGMAVLVAYLQWFTSLDGDKQYSVVMVTLTGALTNIACSVLGCYLLLRGVSLMGDALSHAVLPGLIVAFIVSGSIDLTYMFIGAFCAGLLTTFLSETLNRRGGVPADASLGVVFVSMFALGIILVSRYTGGDIDLDFDCIFSGSLDLVGMTGTLGTLSIDTLPRPLVSITPVLVLNLTCIVLFWKELKVSSFDPALATSMGFRASALHYLLMALVALTTVASFEAVGSILVIAMLIVPAATAHLLTNRLRPMIIIASLIGVATAMLGAWFGRVFSVNSAGLMAVISGGFYLLAVFFSPQYGVISAIVRNLQISARIVREDLLAMLYRLEELAVEQTMGSRQAAQAVGGGLLANWGLMTLKLSGCVVRSARGLKLTDAGRERAVQLVRSHRLWEAYLVQYLGLPLDHVHDPAERLEHYIDEDLREKIAADLKDTAIDPHGRGIPDAGEK